MKRGSAYKRLLRDYGVSKRMVNTLRYLVANGYDGIRLDLGDAMSATGLQRHGLATCHHREARRGERAGLVWAATEAGRDLLEELNAARRADQVVQP